MDSSKIEIRSFTQNNVGQSKGCQYRSSIVHPCGSILLLLCYSPLP